MSSNRNTEARRPLVSVVVPAYNYGRYIAETLENLRAQTYENWDCVVVDDGSTDDTGEIVRRFAERDARVRYVAQKNQRQAVAKNTGLAQSGGEYVQFLDADDLLERRKFERQVEYLESHPEVDIVYGGARYFTDGREQELLYAMIGEDKAWMPEISGAGRPVVRQLLIDNIMVINSPLVRRTVVNEVGPFDTALPLVEDWEYWLRCALAGKRFEFHDFAETRALVRSHPASSSKQRLLAITAIRMMRAKLDALLKDDAELRFLNREMSAQFEAAVGLEETTTGSRLRGARQFLKAGALSGRLSSKARWLACALASTVLSGRQVRRIAAFSPTGAQKPGSGRGSPPDGAGLK
ncbi:MAG TPA: glycosyltransferase family A protein [Pyrinomonadaceae bacterium]|nr:glycosyltransferase family A protein [Pyrinomonadaceae bacterium]